MCCPSQTYHKPVKCLSTLVNTEKLAPTGNVSWILLSVIIYICLDSSYQGKSWYLCYYCRACVKAVCKFYSNIGVFRIKGIFWCLTSIMGKCLHRFFYEGKQS